MIRLMVAMDENRVIGKDGEMPWHLPNDLKYFKRVTEGHAILMGRKTFDSIGRPLPKRRNIVVTRDESFTAEGVETVHDLDHALEQLRHEDGFVIGGAEIFARALPKADKLYITQIHERFEGDTYFPSFLLEEWHLISKEEGQQDEKNAYAHSFLVYERKKHLDIQ